MRAGRLQGHFGDLMNVFTQNATGVGQKIVITTTHTNPEQRAFGLVTSPAAAEKLTSLEAIPAGTKTAMSSATIIDYLLDRMTETTKTEGKLQNLEVKQIPIRLQMLLSNKVDTSPRRAVASSGKTRGSTKPLPSSPSRTTSRPILSSPASGRPSPKPPAASKRTPRSSAP